MPGLWLAGRLPGLNELLDSKSQQHGKWNKYNAKKGQLAATIGLVARSQNLGLQSPCYVSMLVLEPNRKRDPDNITSGAFKIILDSLSSCGVLAGDGWAEILGLAGYWDYIPGKVGTFLHFSQSGLVTKETMQLMLQERLGNEHSGKANGYGAGNRSDAGHRAHAEQDAAGDAPARSELGERTAMGRHHVKRAGR